MSARRERVGGGVTNATPRINNGSARATPRSIRETPRDMSVRSSRRTSPRWEAGNRLDKRRGPPEKDTTFGATNPASRRTSPRWLGGNRIDRQRGMSHSASDGMLLTGDGGLTATNLMAHDGNGVPSNKQKGIIHTSRGSVQSTSRSDAMRHYIGIDPKDATVKHTSYDPLAWYAPTLSLVAPHKTVYLDHNEAARLKKHKTRSEFMQTKKQVTLPHPSYDIDGDGIVNQSDLKVAREVDPRGTGVLDAAGTLNGKRSLARKYLDHNQKERWFKHIAPDVAAMSKDDAVEHVAHQPSFSRYLAALRLKERPGNGTGGRGSRAALVEVDHGWASTLEERGPLIPTMVPATERRDGNTSERGSGGGGGGGGGSGGGSSSGSGGMSLSMRPARSQSELFSTRKRQAILENQRRFEVEPTSQDNKRVDLITVPKAWTRCENTSKGFLRNLYENQKEMSSNKGPM